MLLGTGSVLYHSHFSHLCISIKNSAPEVINRKPYDQKVDMWSIGVTCYLLLCGDTPFNGKNRQQLFRRISCDEPTFPDDKWGHVSDEAVEFVRKLLTKDPAKRLSAAQALQHRWLTETNSMMAQQEQPVMNSFVSEAESSEERTARSSDLRASGSAKSPGSRVSNHSNEKQLKPSRSKSNSNRSISRDRIKNRSITRDARTKSRSASQERRKARTKTPPPPPKPQATSPRENSSKKLSANNNSSGEKASSHSASDENAKLLDVIKNQDAKIERLEAMVKRMLEPEAAVHEC